MNRTRRGPTTGRAGVGVPDDDERDALLVLGGGARPAASAAVNAGFAADGKLPAFLAGG